ncbi:MAG: hypothetical protein ABW203_03745 [Novosphingobium sp.]
MVLVAGCSRQPSLAEKSAADARAVAQVEAVQAEKPPPQPIAPQPIVFADIDRHDLYGAGCAFAPGGNMGAVLLTRESGGYLKLGEALIRLAADPGSGELPLGTRTHYTGKAFSVDLARTSPAAEASNGNLRWPGRLTVRDPYDRVIYRSEGSVQCGS